MKNITQRTVVLILVGIALLAMISLAAGLAELPMAPGKDLPMESQVPEIGTALPGDDSFMQGFVLVLRIFMTILWAAIPFYIIYLILSPEARKQFLRDMARLLPIAALLYFFLANRSGRGVFHTMEMKLDAAGTPQPVPGEEGIAPEFVANPSEWLVTLTSLIIAVVLTVLLVALVWLLWRERQKRLNKLKPLQQVAEEAQHAIDAIQSGGDLRDVVMRCYLEMTKVVGEQRNLQRGEAMTPHEFEVYLEQRGMPPEPVRQLTQLFERVRYGAHNPGMQDERVAISSLTAIVAACRRSH